MGGLSERLSLLFLRVFRYTGLHWAEEAESKDTAFQSLVAGSVDFQVMGRTIWRIIAVASGASFFPHWVQGGLALLFKCSRQRARVVFRSVVYQHV